ncbi:hypothetical protein GCM10023314_18960 [Algibacter agarivorans]|uniref:Uncharacterized protein n=1 Tax=Algibacter agarivorans TaxID=1109741 RepID=A0ABP9GNR0_9FLAO
MEEFLFEHRTEITRVVEFMAAITGIVLFKKYKHTNAKYFIFFLIYLSLGDFGNTYTKYVKNDGFFNFLEGTVFEKNYWWSTLFWKIGAILFFAYYYNKILSNKKFKIIIKFIGFIFFVFSFVYILLNWDEYFIRYFPAISIFGAFIIFMCTVFYFIEVLQSNKILIFYKSLNFYISFAIFIWWLIITPIVFFDIYLLNRDINYIQLRYFIYLLANIIMYSTFTFALIWCRPQND